jgi:hypothetical protein
MMHVSWTTLREQIFVKLRRPYRSEANMNEVGHGMGYLCRQNAVVAADLYLQRCPNRKHIFNFLFIYIFYKMSYPYYCMSCI